MADCTEGAEDEDILEHSHDTKKVSPRAPNKKKFEEEIELLNAAIKEKETQLKNLTSSRSDENLGHKLREIRAEKEVTLARRRRIDNDLSKLNQDITKQNAVLTKVQSDLQYKNEDRINQAIARLEHQIKSSTFRLNEERRIVAEIDSLKRSKKALGRYLEVQKCTDDMRNRQRRMREERDHYFKSLRQLKTREDTLKQSSQEAKTQCEQLQKDLEDLREQRRVVTVEFRNQEREYQRSVVEQRRRHREETTRRREEGRRQEQQEHAKQRAEYEASREPFEDERQLCSTLITYLQRHLPANASDSQDSLGADSNKVLQLDGLFVLKKKSDDDLDKRKLLKKTKKERRKPNLNKSLVHSPQIFAEFESLNLKAPATVSEVWTSIEELAHKKSVFEEYCGVEGGMVVPPVERDGSGGAPSFTESAICESIPTTPEVLQDATVQPRLTRDQPLAMSLLCSEPRPRKLSHDSGAFELDEQTVCDGASGLVCDVASLAVCDPAGSHMMEDSVETSCDLGNDFPKLCVTDSADLVMDKPRIILAEPPERLIENQVS